MLKSKSVMIDDVSYVITELSAWAHMQPRNESDDTSSHKWIIKWGLIVNGKTMTDDEVLSFLQCITGAQLRFVEEAIYEFNKESSEIGKKTLISP